MTPVSCIAMDGEEGDCFRAALASVMNLPCSEVPHFAQIHKERGGVDDRGGDSFDDLVNEWLQEFGLTMGCAVLGPEEPWDMIPIYVNNLSPGTPCILSGMTASGGGHSVVARNGEIFNPSTADIIAPFDIGWWITFISVGHNFVARRVKDGL